MAAKTPIIPIILTTISRYIGKEEYRNLLTDLGNYQNLGPVRIKKHLEKYFDVNSLVKSPNLPEEAILGNYLLYDATTKFPLKGPIAKFIKAFIPNDEEYWNKVNSTKGK